MDTGTVSRLKLQAVNIENNGTQSNKRSNYRPQTLFILVNEQTVREALF